MQAGGTKTKPARKLQDRQGVEVLLAPVTRATARIGPQKGPNPLP